MGPEGQSDGQGEAVAFLERLEKLVVPILASRFKTVDDLWNIQLELLALQRDIQAAIGKRKSHGRRGQKADLDALRQALWHARRLGDAFAWVLFRSRRRWIYPLAENQRAPVPPEDHAAQGVMAIATDLMSKGYGFPLLHDITDVLRVGDVTFFQLDGPPRTVEVKSSRVASEPGQGGTTYTYRVAATWPMEGPAAAEEPGDRNPRSGPAALRSQRFRRQLSRMTKARVLSTADFGEDGTLIQVDGGPMLLTEVRAAAPRSHWPLIRRLVRAARKTGFASGVAEQTVMYAAFYRKEAFDDAADIPHLPELPGALVESGIFFEGPLREKNQLVISTLPDWRGRGPHLYLPYFLYPLPRSAVLNLLHGRLILLSLLNLGRIAVALEEAGFRVELPEKEREYKRSPLRVFTEVTAGGRRFSVELGGLHMPLTEMIMEASSPQSFVEWVRAAARGAAVQAPVVLKDERGIGEAPATPPSAL